MQKQAINKMSIDQIDSDPDSDFDILKACSINVYRLLMFDHQLSIMS